MNVKTKLILSGIGLTALTVLSANQVEAFAPWDWIKSKLSPQQQTQMDAYHSERDESLARFLGMSTTDVQKELANGKRPRDLMDAAKLAEWKTSRQQIKSQHQQEFGASHYEYGQGRGNGRGFGRSNSN